MRGSVRGLLAVLAATALMLFPVAGAAQAAAPTGSAGTTSSTAASSAGSTAASTTGGTAGGGVAADPVVAAYTSGGDRDSWRAAIRMPRAWQSIGTATAAVLPVVTLATALFLLLVTRRVAVRPARSAPRKRYPARGPPGSIDR